MSVKISVTLPVYNVEKYLRRCLNSILNQTFKGTYEIICVDDGSTDKSPDILKEYSEKYPHIKVVRQENQGLSVARNTAMKYVTGKYVMFVDSDDFLALDALEKLYKYAQEYRCDVVIFDFIRNIDGTSKVSRQTFPNVSRKYGSRLFNANTAEPFVYRFIPVATWNKFYRTDLVKDIEFVKDLNNQDVVHWAEVYSKAKRVSYLPLPFYSYTTKREGAITQIKGKKAFDVFRAFSLTEQVLTRAGLFDKFRSIHYAHFTCNLVHALRKVNSDLRDELVKKIKETPINIDYDLFQKEDFFQFEKENMEIIRFVKERSIAEIEILLKSKRVW